MNGKRTVASLIAVVLIILSAMSECVAADAGQCTREGTAIRRLRSRIESEHLYALWATMSCLSFLVEECDSKKADIAVREVHNEECGGDPAAAPVVDRFRVLKKSGRIQWYNLPNGEYVPFAKVHSVGHR